MITDAELQGLALQALNMAKRDHEQDRLTCLLASYHQGESIHRMRLIEDLLVKKLGQDWLNKRNSKNFAFGMMRMALQQAPCDAFVFVSAGNQFRPTEAFRRLGAEQQKAIFNSGHDLHHRAVKEGLFSIQDCLYAMVQTATRVCVYVQAIGDQHNFEGAPEVNFFDQRELQGTMKMFGTEVQQ